MDFLIIDDRELSLSSS